jgi:asparagine synthase (glutamine-hydrolysing)
MSAVAAVAGPRGAPHAEVARAMLAAMPRRGNIAAASVGGDDRCALATCRFDWERSAEVATVGGITVCADATLYYRDDLARRVLGRRARPEEHAAQLIAHAWNARGEAALSLLEGDFAFVVWDAPNATLTAARDFGGKRTLFHCWHGGTLRVASTVGAILADPTVPRAIDFATVASVAAGLWTHPPASAFADITELPAGFMLRWRPGQAPTVREYWEAPLDVETRRQPLDPAADELGALLEDAVRERLDGANPTVVSLSGGWDSTAVYGVGRSIAGDGVHGVSISYPEGDPGYEDHFIRDVTSRWSATPDFIDAYGIPLFVDAAAAAARREHPFAHVYEHWNRALSKRARRANARVMLDGIGGDQLFQVSDVYLAELFRTFQWGELAAQYRVKRTGGGSLREFYEAAIAPALPERVQRRIARARGVEYRHYLERRAPIWFTPEFFRTHRVLARESAAQPPLPKGNLVRAEAEVFLRFPFYPRVFAELYGFALEEGVEMRSPLLDERVVRFAMRRPWSDRADGGETKRLLRRAMRNLLPASVLAPRPHRTGTTSAYFMRGMREEGWPLAERTLAESRLAQMGMIDVATLRRAWEHVLEHEDEQLAGRVYFTLQAELWMRGQTD